MKVAKRLECGQLAAAFERTPSVQQPQRCERMPCTPDVAQAGDLRNRLPITTTKGLSGVWGGLAHTKSGSKLTALQTLRGLAA